MFKESTINAAQNKTFSKFLTKFYQGYPGGQVCQEKYDKWKSHLEGWKYQECFLYHWDWLKYLNQYMNLTVQAT